jgi:hypothetical protein
MLEGLIERIILTYFGDYIENLDQNKLSLGVMQFLFYIIKYSYGLVV